MALSIPVAMRIKAWVCSRKLAGIAGSNLSGVMDVCLFERRVFSVRGLCGVIFRRFRVTIVAV